MKGGKSVAVPEETHHGPQSSSYILLPGHKCPILGEGTQERKTAGDSFQIQCSSRPVQSPLQLH